MNSDIEKSIQEQEEAYQRELSLLQIDQEWEFNVLFAERYGYSMYGTFIQGAFCLLATRNGRDPKAFIHRQRLIKHLYNEVINQNK